MPSPSKQNSFALFATLPRQVKFLVLGTAINFAGSMVGPLLTIVLVRIFGMSPTDASWIAASFAAGSFTAVFCGGILTDRFGRRRTLLLSMFGAGTVGIALALSSSLKSFHILIVLFAFFAELYRPASSSLTADLLDSNRRALGYGAIRVAINLGGFIAMFLGGYFLDHDWRWMLWFDAATCIGFGLIVYFQIEEPKRAHQDVSANREALPQSRPPWRDVAFIKYFAMSLLLCLVYASHFSVLPLTMAREGGLSNQAIGTIMGMNGVLVVLLELNTISRMSRFRRLRVAAVGTAFIGVGLAMTPFSSHWLWYVFTLLIWTIGEISCFSFAMSFVSDLAPADRRGQYLSYSGLTWRAALALNPVIFMPLYERMDARAFWALHAVLVVPAVWLLLNLDRRHEVIGSGG